MLAEQIDGDARAGWVAGTGQSPMEAREALEKWLGGADGPPPGMSREQWELRRELGVA